MYFVDGSGEGAGFSLLDSKLTTGWKTTVAVGVYRGRSNVDGLVNIFISPVTICIADLKQTADSCIFPFPLLLQGYWIFFTSCVFSKIAYTCFLET
jgi:hypothetical protein